MIDEGKKYPIEWVLGNDKSLVELLTENVVDMGKETIANTEIKGAVESSLDNRHTTQTSL